MNKLNLLTASALFIPASLMAQQITPQNYKPGDYQTENPFVQQRNPFYFEGRVDWNLLKITTPSNAWEFAQRGIHFQDDLEDFTNAIADYKKSISMNSLDNGSCQLINAAPVGFGQKTNPAPCMFTVRLRLAYLLHEEDPAEAIRLFREVLQIDPLRLGVNALIGETYHSMAEHAKTEAEKHSALEKAIEAFKAELLLSPVTPLSVQLTGDEANNAHAHWAMAEIYEELGKEEDAAKELDLYIKATKWHSDTYPWRIQLAKKRIEKLHAAATTKQQQ